MCLHWGSDTKTGSKGSLGGGITGGVALGVVSWTTHCYYLAEVCGDCFRHFDNFLSPCAFFFGDYDQGFSTDMTIECYSF